MKEANKEITLLVELAEIVILFDKMQQENISVMNKNDGFLDAGAQSIILSNKREAKKMEDRVSIIISELGGDVKAGELVEKYSEEVSVIIIKKGYKK